MLISFKGVFIIILFLTNYDYRDERIIKIYPIFTELVPIYSALYLLTVP